MDLPLIRSKRWARGVLNPSGQASCLPMIAFDTAQQVPLIKRGALNSALEAFGIPQQVPLIRRWKRLVPKKPIIKRRIRGKQPGPLVMHHQRAMQQVHLIKTALDTGEYN